MTDYREDEEFLAVVRDFEERIARNPEYWANLSEKNLAECRNRYEAAGNQNITFEESSDRIRNIIESMQNDDGKDH
jgi:hypothetical protein